jgi:hypothetical protein
MFFQNLCTIINTELFVINHTSVYLHTLERLFETMSTIRPRNHVGEKARLPPTMVKDERRETIWEDLGVNFGEEKDKKVVAFGEEKEKKVVAFGDDKVKEFTMVRGEKINRKIKIKLPSDWLNSIDYLETRLDQLGAIPRYAAIAEDLFQVMNDRLAKHVLINRLIKKIRLDTTSRTAKLAKIANLEDLIQKLQANEKERMAKTSEHIAYVVAADPNESKVRALLRIFDKMKEYKSTNIDDTLNIIEKVLGHKI